MFFRQVARLACVVCLSISWSSCFWEEISCLIKRRGTLGWLGNKLCCKLSHSRFWAWDKSPKFCFTSSRYSWYSRASLCRFFRAAMWPMFGRGPWQVWFSGTTSATAPLCLSCLLFRWTGESRLLKASLKVSWIKTWRRSHLVWTSTLTSPKTNISGLSKVHWFQASETVSRHSSGPRWVGHNNLGLLGSLPQIGAKTEALISMEMMRWSLMWMGGDETWPHDEVLEETKKSISRSLSQRVAACNRHTDPPSPPATSQKWLSSGVSLKSPATSHGMLVPKFSDAINTSVSKVLAACGETWRGGA